MKAIFFEAHGGLDVLKYGDVPDPSPEAGEVVIKVEAAGINFNDIWARKGLPHVEVPLPHISGTEASGVVVALGEGVQTLRLGDEVVVHPIQSCGVCPACLAGEDVFCRHMKVWGFQTGPYIGAYAQYARVRAAQCFAKPAHLSWTEAAVASGVAATAWRMLVTRAQVKPGETVLIFGASGGTGAAGIQLAKAMGATVIAVTSSKPKAEFCLKQGADHVIRSDVSDVAKEARLITNRRGVDVVFDHIGETTWPIGINALRWGGRLVICGATEGFDAKVDLRHLWNKQLSLLGSHAANHRDCGEVLRMIEQRQLRPAMTEVIGLQDIPDAHRRMEARQIMGKIAVDVVGR